MTTSQQEQHYAKILKSGATFLARWRHASAEMWELTRSLRSLLLVLQRHDRPGNLVLACSGPLRIRGPVQWENSDIAISRSAVPGDPHDGFLVVDVGADLENLCGSLQIKENVKLYGIARA